MVSTGPPQWFVVAIAIVGVHSSMLQDRGSPALAVNSDFGRSALPGGAAGAGLGFLSSRVWVSC